MNEFATTANLSESNVCERTLVGVDEAARILHKSKHTIYQWVRTGRDSMLQNRKKSIISEG